MGPGSVMLITDHINFSGPNPLIGEPTDRRFVGLTEAYDRHHRAWRSRSGRSATGTPLHKGVYMWFSGPSFETPAEIRMARVMGANAVGMSTVPEVILARFLGLRVAACSVITNLAAGMTGARAVAPGDQGHRAARRRAARGDPEACVRQADMASWTRDAVTWPAGSDDAPPGNHPQASATARR